MRVVVFFCFFFKQKTAYEMRISDWSSDVCSSDLDHCMADNDDFDLWLGRIGRDTPAVGKSLARARRAGGHGSVAGRRFTGARLGRGNGIGRVLRQGSDRKSVV